ncbi:MULTISPECIES: hypothetical protein [Idiomarina]|jgi:hypothetical protein|uniref:hypothetical protein n=1 Tax=Idiomarina TaxID=135575 RepID=UPI000C677251|nr:MULTISPECIES: hypothetical protein [Idiomarina]MAB22733.1 hypothetical protein [Idiomarina sp.]MBH95455.1 hypothetical protein [Idiomarina sp.]MBP59117.1 hypothetical protein [Idiomarina sp.]HAS15418.1 hypothetical protein [Idiomarina abyssalis]|tara:strand:+ start:148 stop:942 length:795 start_codon:yes stop_codon:yes gene_type:complete
MFEKKKVWLGVGSVLATTVAASQVSATVLTQPSAAPTMFMAAPMAEGEMAAPEIDLNTNDTAFLAQLGFIRGHLWVGMKLYEQGHIEMAKTHMKHPGDELYSGLTEAFEARGLPGFAEPLNTLAESVINDQSKDVVMNNYNELRDAISANEPIDNMLAKDVILSISSMLMVAADEYAVGIQNGEVANVHEYQDALGFKEIALDRLNRINDAEAHKAQDAINETRQVINNLNNLWPTTTPEAKVDGEPSKIYGAASRIELEARSI